MAFYHQPWPASAPQQSSRPSTSSATSGEPEAFLSQLEEIDRAIDNMIKSGSFVGAMGPGAMRHDSHAMPSRPYSGYGHMHARQAVPEYEGMHANSAAASRGFYPPQHYTPVDAEQNKRRMAAQRERELRNYHREQQYSRSSNAKSDRPISPEAVKEEDRRDLLARQHRALYGKESTMYGSDGSHPATPANAAQAQASMDSAVQMPARDLHTDSRRASISAKMGMPSFGTSESAPGSGSRTATASPLASPAVGSGGLPPPASGIGAIGSRLGQSQPGAKHASSPKERSLSAASNPAAASDKAPPTFGAWNNSGVWGTPKSGLQASVWG